MPELVRVEHVTQTFRSARVTALQDLSLSMAPGQIVAITGPSGSGKSTLLRLMAGLDRPSQGRVLFEGRDMYKESRLARLRARSIGIVFQFFHLLPILTAAENIEVPMFGVERSAAARGRRVRLLLEQVGLSHRADHRPALLSGGECQRVAVARALANQPRLLLADEPTGNLDSDASRRILDLLLSVAGQTGAALVIATHDPAVAARMPTRLQLLDGRRADEPALAGREAG